MQRGTLLVGMLALLLLLPSGGCDITPGASVAGGSAEVTEGAIDHYLSRVEMARPEIVREVVRTLRAGKRFRKRFKDQRNRWVLATIWLDADRPNVLHIVAKRDETCPDCNGTGNRSFKNPVVDELPFQLDCLRCKGKGYIANKVTEWKFVISAMDTADPDATRAKQNRRAFADAPAEAERHVAALASDDPRERLEACLWLDANFVRVGDFFQSILPMLRKARFRETSTKRELMVYEFWAGRGDRTLADRAYYRVYVDTESGKVTRKGFYPER